MQKYVCDIFPLICGTNLRVCRLWKAKYGQTKAEHEVVPTCTKIYYASRTHSQLSQVLHELQKLDISLSPSSVLSLHAEAGDVPPSLAATNIPNSKRSHSELDAEEMSAKVVDVRTVSLASRKQLCINEKLKAKAGDLDEACRQLLSG